MESEQTVDTEQETQEPEQTTGETQESIEVAPEPTRENDEIRTLKEEKNRLSSELLESRMQRSSQPEIPTPPPVFDTETDKNVGTLVDRRLDSQTQSMKDEVATLRMQLLDQQMSQDPAFGAKWTEYKDTKVREKFAELHAEGFGGPKTAKVLLAAVLADTGEFEQKGRDNAIKQQKQRAATEAPSGAAPAKSEPTRMDNILSKGGEDFEALTAAIKRGDLKDWPS